MCKKEKCVYGEGRMLVFTSPQRKIDIQDKRQTDLNSLVNLVLDAQNKALQ